MTSFAMIIISVNLQMKKLSAKFFAPYDFI